MSAALKKNQARVLEMIREFKIRDPNPSCALHHRNAEELLIATILSAQCTDARVNMVTPGLFEKYPNMKSLSEANLEELENDIRTTGFFRNKARSLKNAARSLVENFNGKVPNSMEELVKLPGVGRKTANVVLGDAFKNPNGIVVDTHVTRLSRRLGLVRGRLSAEAIEQKLIPLVPKEHWVSFSHWLILHGRKICKARRPLCEVCYLNKLCPKII